MGKFNFIWLGCKKATSLMSKKEEGKLTLIESIQLKLHLRICDFCNRFQQQTGFFTKHSPHVHDHLPKKLSEEKKAAIKELLKEP